MPSTAIRHIAYNKQRHEMTVIFITGRRYIYYDVPAVVVTAFREASSRGAFFNQEIRDRYDCREIRP